MKVKNLAEMLNLSPSTVSLVLNNRPGISEATRNRVIEAVHQLGCEELLTQSDGRRRTILFVVYRKHGMKEAEKENFSQLFSEVIEGVELQAREKGFQIMVSYTDQQSYRDEAVRIRKAKAEGVLLLATEMGEDQLSAFMGMQVPLVLLDNYLEQKMLDCVTINNEMGVFQAVSHLAAQGHRKIGYLHIMQNANNFSERYFGFLRAMERLGIPVRREWILEMDTQGGETLYPDLEHKLALLEDMPTAFFADNDIVAVCAVRALRKLGLHVPDDVSFVGFDNMALSEMTDPPLTTIRVSKRQMGMEAVNSIVERIEKRQIGNLKTEISTELIIRQSVKQLR